MVRPLNRISNSSIFRDWVRNTKKDNFEVTMYDGYIKEDLDLELKSMTDINLRYITQDSKLDIDEILSGIHYCDRNSVYIGYMGELNMIEAVSKCDAGSATTCYRCGGSLDSIRSELCIECNNRLLIEVNSSRSAVILESVDEGNLPRVNNLDAYI